MGKMKWFDWTAFVLLVVGGINWGLTLFKWDIAQWLPAMWLPWIFGLVGLAGVYGVIALFKLAK